MKNSIEGFRDYRKEYCCEHVNGDKLNIDIDIKIDFTSFDKILKNIVIENNKNFIMTMLKQNTEEENLIYNKILDSVDLWYEKACKTYLYKKALMYYEICEQIKRLETTNNEWIIEKDNYTTQYKISNKTYEMSIFIYTDRNYKDNSINYYEVSYSIYTRNIYNLNQTVGNNVKNINRKHFKDEKEMNKYIEGRKKYYSKYFEELYNPIFENDVDYFKYNGILLKPYTIAKK